MCHEADLTRRKEIQIGCVACQLKIYKYGYFVERKERCWPLADLFSVPEYLYNEAECPHNR
jgi:hypothetical protein